MRLCLHTSTADSIPGVSWLTGARVASWSVAAVGVSTTTSVVRGTLVDICIITDITREFDDTGRQNTTTLSLSLSLPAQNLPLSQIFPIADCSPASGLTTWTV